MSGFEAIDWTSAGFIPLQRLPPSHPPPPPKLYICGWCLAAQEKLKVHSGVRDEPQKLEECRWEAHLTEGPCTSWLRAVTSTENSKRWAPGPRGLAARSTRLSKARPLLKYLFITSPLLWLKLLSLTHANATRTAVLDPASQADTTWLYISRDT